MSMNSLFCLILPLLIQIYHDRLDSFYIIWGGRLLFHLVVDTRFLLGLILNGCEVREALLLPAFPRFRLFPAFGPYVACAHRMGRIVNLLGFFR